MICGNLSLTQSNITIIVLSLWLLPSTQNQSNQENNQEKSRNQQEESDKK